MTAKGYNKQTHTYFAQPIAGNPVSQKWLIKRMLDLSLILLFQHPVTIKAGVDDVKYGTFNEDIHIKVYQLSNVQAVTFTDVFQVYV
jgi:hypothetical protein